MEEDPEAGQSMMNLHTKRNCSGLKNSRRICSRRNLPHKSLTFFAISLISFSVFLMRVEYGPNPCSSPQSKARPKPRTKRDRVSLNSRSMRWNIGLGERSEHVRHEEPPKHQFIPCQLIKHTNCMTSMDSKTKRRRRKSKSQTKTKMFH